MPDSKERISILQRLRQWMVPAVILLMAVGIVFLIVGNWNTWASEKASQETDDAYTQADLTPLSTKVAGLVAVVPVSVVRGARDGSNAARSRSPVLVGIDGKISPAAVIHPHSSAVKPPAITLVAS